MDTNKPSAGGWKSISIPGTDPQGHPRVALVPQDATSCQDPRGTRHRLSGHRTREEHNGWCEGFHAGVKAYREAVAPAVAELVAGLREISEYGKSFPGNFRLSWIGERARALVEKYAP